MPHLVHAMAHILHTARAHDSSGHVATVMQFHQPSESVSASEADEEARKKVLDRLDQITAYQDAAARWQRGLTTPKTCAISARCDVGSESLNRPGNGIGKLWP